MQKYCDEQDIMFLFLFVVNVWPIGNQGPYITKNFKQMLKFRKTIYQFQHVIINPKAWYLGNFDIDYFEVMIWLQKNIWNRKRIGYISLNCINHHDRKVTFFGLQNFVFKINKIFHRIVYLCIKKCLFYNIYFFPFCNTRDIGLTNFYIFMLLLNIFQENIT